MLLVLHERESRGEIQQTDLANGGIAELSMWLWIIAGHVALICVRMSTAIGASQSGKQEPAALKSKELKRRFLTDMVRVLEGVGTVSPPHTIHNLVGLRDFLAPGDPAAAFAGREYGYQFEGAGIDRVVEIVGYYLADHRGLFDNDDRRKRLIDCLDMFVDAGWPAATRLLYRLPEVL